MILTVAACDTPEEKAKAHYEAGMAFIKEGNFVKAGIEFRNALQLREIYADGWYGLALVEESEGNWKKYAGDILKAIEIDPKHVGAQVRYGKMMLSSGRLEDALKTSDLAISLAPENPEVLALKSAVMFKLGDKTAAIAAAKSALAVDPSNIDAVAVLAAERLADHDPAGAVAILDEGIQHSKDSTPLQIVKIRALEKLGKTDEIVQVFQNLIAKNPGNPAFRKSLVSFYLKNGETAKAEETIRDITREKPEDVTAELDVVRFLKTVKGAAAAREELEKLIDQFPDVNEYRFAMAELAKATNDDEKAIEILRSIVVNAKTTENAIISRNKLAQMLLAKGNVAEAKDLAYQVLDMDGINTDALILVGAMQIDEGNIDGAISNLRTALKQQPQSVRGSLLLARAHEINGSLELAEDRFAAAYRSSKQAPAVGLTYAQFFLRHSEFKRAENLLEKIAAKAPDNADVLKTLAQVKLTQQDWSGAEKLADKIRTIDQSNSAAYQISGAALAGMKNIDDSESAFEKAYEITPEAGEAMVSLVQAYLRGGKVDKAESFLKSVLASGNDNYQAKILLAQILFGKDQTKEAEKLLKEAIAADPKEQTGYVTLAKYYSAVGRPEEAQEILSEGLKEQPNAFLLNLTQAGLYEAQKKFPAAISVYEKMLKDKPNSEIVANNLASLIAEEAGDEEALRRAYALAKRFRTSNVPYFKDTLGWIHYRLGEIEAAIPLLREAAEQVPNMPILRYHLGMAYKAQKETEKAVKEIEAALKLGEKQNFAQSEEAKKALEELRASPK